MRVYVRRLRAKLEGDDGEPLIVTAPRAGYRFVAVTLAGVTYDVYRVVYASPSDINGPFTVSVRSA